MVENVKILIHNAELEGILAVPKDAVGMVLFAHGSGSSRLSSRNQRVAASLNEIGIGTLLFDLLTKEEEEVDAVTMQFRFDIPFLARRLEQVSDWLKERYPQVRIGYFGASTGAAAALMAAEHREVDAIVSRGGRPDLAGKALSKVSAPTLLIVGELDPVVIELNEKAYEVLACEKKLLIVPGATHLFEEKGALEEVAHLARSWFLLHLAIPKH